MVSSAFLRPATQALLLAVLATAPLVRAQTREEQIAHQQALLSRETALRAIKEGQMLAATKDAYALDGTPRDNSETRRRGTEKVEKAKVQLAEAEAAIQAYADRQKALRELVANPERTLELESSDGRKATFSVELVELPMAHLVTKDLNVHVVPLDKLSKESAAKVRRFAAPALKVTLTSTYGANFFPVAYLHRARPAADQPAQETPANALPDWKLQVEAEPLPGNRKPSATASLSLASEAPGFAPPAAEPAEFDLSGAKPFAKALPIAFGEPALKSNKSAVPATMTLNFDYGDDIVDTRSFAFTCHGLTDIPVAVAQPDGKLLDTRPLFAACVDESLPAFDKLRNEAMAAGIVSSFGTFTSSDDARGQMLAYWNHLAQASVRIVDAKESVATGADYIVQKVKLPAESTTANELSTADATLLLASFATNIGLDAVVAFRPGHFFLILRTPAGEFVPLETMVLNDTGLASEKDPARRLGLVKANLKRAEETARANNGEQIGQLASSPDFGRHHPEGTTLDQLKERYQFVDIKKARTAGVLKL